jgi:hypothetical protein
MGTLRSQGQPMKRTTLNFILDSVSFVNLLLLAATGTIMRWVLPPGSGGGQGYGFRGGRGPGEVKLLLGLGRHDWGDIHFVLALLFLFLMLVHLYLHWTWIKTCGKSILFPSRRAPCDPQDKPGSKL